MKCTIAERFKSIRYFSYSESNVKIIIRDSAVKCKFAVLEITFQNKSRLLHERNEPK